MPWFKEVLWLYSDFIDVEVIPNDNAEQVSLRLH
jgi:hypothetical protein